MTTNQIFNVKFTAEQVRYQFHMSFQDFLSILPGFFHSLIFYPIYHFFISWPMFSALSAIHQKFELPSPNYSYGLFPISYVQQNSIYIAHGADPIVIDAEYSLPNVYPIGKHSHSRVS